MIKTRLIGILAAILIGITSIATLPTHAEAASKTKCRGATTAGECVQVTKWQKKLYVTQSVLVENKRKSTITGSCSFDETITKSFSAGISLTAGAKADVLGLAEVSSSINLSMSVTQTASSASHAAATFPLKKGEAVLCQRTYGYLSTTIHYSTWSGHTSHSGTYVVKIPIRMGVRVLDA